MPGSGASLTSAWTATFTSPDERRLVTMSLIDSVGTGLYIAGSVIYFTRAVGLSAAQVGLGLSIASVVGLAGVIPAGWAAQRFGTWRTLLVFDLWRMAGFASYVFIHSFAWFLVVVCLLAIPEQSVSPLMQRLVEQVVGRADRTLMMGKVRAVYNIGFTVGAPLSGLAVKFGTTTGYDAIMLGDAATYVLAALLLVRLARHSDLGRPGRGDGGEKDGPVTTHRFSLGALRDRRYMGTAGINGIMSLHMTILSVAMPLWVIMHTSVPRYLVGPLLLINTALVIPLQVPISSVATSVARSIRLMRVAGFTLSACCLLLATAAWLPAVPAVIVLAAAIAFLTAGEMTQSASGWMLAYELAPTQARAECLTTFGLGTSAQFVVGPLLLTDAIIAHGTAGWIGLSIAFLLISMTLAVIIRPGRPTGDDSAQPPPEDR
jgi:MFS family permease